MSTDVSSRLEWARQIAHRAGDVTLKYFQGDFQRDVKLDGSIVTTADREAERLLRDLIRERFPEDGILGEEYGEQSGSSPYRWILDPIDGTVSFAQGVPLYGVLIGIEDAGEKRCPAGVIHIPALRETVYAQRGCGTTWERRGPDDRTVSSRARVSTVASLDRAVMLGTDFFKLGVGPQRDAMARLAARVRIVRTWSDCYGYVLVATGRAELMLDPVMHVWDCAPLQPVLEESGGAFTDWQGNPTIYGECAVASNGILHRQVLDLLGPV